MSEDILNVQPVDLSKAIAYHTDFADFLSFDEAVSSFCQCLDYFRSLSDEALLSDDQHKKLEEISTALDQLAVRLVRLLQGPELLNQSKKLELIRAFNEYPLPFSKLLNKQKNFQHLRFMLTALKNYPTETLATSLINGTPTEVFDLLLKTSDDELSLNGVNYYKTKFVDQKSLEYSRLQLAHVFLNSVRQNEMSDFKREFIVEWIFDSSLINALLFDELVYRFVSILKDTVKMFGTDVSVMHGLLKALQKDNSALHRFCAQKDAPFHPDMIEKASMLIESIFPTFVSLAKENLSFISKHMIGFAFDLSVPKEEYRLFKWNQWRWIRMLATGTWDASLREPPSWVISGGSVYCAVIFDAAPPIWLTNYAYMLIERVYAETIVDGFMPTLQHYDYVEFLIRCLKKKSPYFGSKPDCYLALHLLSRLTAREAHKESSLKFDNIPDSANPVTQALSVLLRMTRV